MSDFNSEIFERYSNQLAEEQAAARNGGEGDDYGYDEDGKYEGYEEDEELSLRQRVLNKANDQAESIQEQEQKENKSSESSKRLLRLAWVGFFGWGFFYVNWHVFCRLCGGNQCKLGEELPDPDPGFGMIEAMGLALADSIVLFTIILMLGVLVSITNSPTKMAGIAVDTAIQKISGE